MQTLKKGSKGEDVKKLQKLLNISADGIFGSNTEKAVIQFQKEHNLGQDGVVGLKTWEALGVTTSNYNSKVVDPSIVYSPLNSCITKANRLIKYLVIHYTAGASSAPGKAKTMKSSWEKSKKASADFGVDDATIVQFNPDPERYYCWAVGGGNGITNTND